jgi:tripartite-type tricarboxylate transporter receptor subunit TctC
MRNRRVAAGLLLCLMSTAMMAQTYPTKPVRIIIRSAAGGADDLHGRLAAQKLQEVMGNPVIVDYRPGAGGFIAWEHVANAAPDGHTVLLASSGLGAVKSIRPSTTLDPWRDFTWVSQIAHFSILFVTHPQLPVKNAKELIALARNRPGQLSYGNTGIGATPHLAAEYFKHMTKVDVVSIPYKGSAPLSVDLMAGQIGVGVSVIASFMPYVKSGRMRALGVTSAKRAPQLPDVPTIAESGVPGYTFSSFYALLVPAKTPRDTVNTLAAATVRAVAMPDFRERLFNAGTDALSNTPEEMLKLAKQAGTQIDEIIRIAGIKGE